jgi:pimeloyl-ACP methyl ester carboxylesterase
MRAGFELYRAFDRDTEDNRAALERHGKLTIPVLAVGGASRTSGPLVEEMMREAAEHVAGLRVPGTAHWIPEENRRRWSAPCWHSPAQPRAANCFALT